MLDMVIAWGMLGPQELLIILLIVVVLFGAKRIPELARSLGQGIKEFQKSTRETPEEEEKDKASGEKPS